MRSKAQAADSPGVCADISAVADHQKVVDGHFRTHSDRWREVYAEAGVEGAIYRERLAVGLKWIDELAMPPGQQVLEIGCGAGLSVVALAQRGYLVEAVDSVAQMLNLTRQYAAAAGVSSSVSTSLGDAHSLAFPEGVFSLVLAIGVIPYLHSPQKALAEMARVLKPGGFLLVTVGNRWRLHHILDPWLCPALEPAKKVARATVRRARKPQLEPIWPPLTLGSLRELEGWLSPVGLGKAKAKTVGFQGLTFHGRQIFGERTSTRLNRWLQWLVDHNVPGIKSSGMDYIVIARKREH